ncbi:MAG: hypothetical protein ACI828_002224 [Flavobacteriales bacterium]|jgi:hypothetical protein
MNRFLILFFTIVALQTKAQEPVLSLPANKDLKKSDQIFAIPNKTGKEFATFVIKNKTITGILIDANFQVKKELTTSIKSNFGSMIAHEYVSNFYSIYFFSQIDKKLRRIRFDFENSSTRVTSANIPSKKQIFLKGFAYQDHFYIVNIHKNSSKLHFYIFSPDGGVSEKEIELPEYFRNFKKRPSTLYDNITLGSPRMSKIARVDEELPTPTTISAHASKMYLKDSSLIFTADKNPFYTYIIDIDLQNFEGNVNVFAKRVLDNPDVITRSNSFLNDGLLYSLTHNGIELYIDIWNLASRAKVKELAFHKTEDVFLEHPVLEEGLFEEDQLKRLKTKKILSNFGAGSKGISIKKVGDNYLFILGSTYPNAIPNFTTSFGDFSTMRYSIQDYETKRELEAYFDKDFNLITTPVQANAFDNLRFISQQADFKKIDALLKIDDAYVFMYLMTKTGKINYFVSKETE